jgi:hypothetical protein
MPRLRRLASLSWQEQSLLLGAAAPVGIIRMGLWLSPFSLVRRIASAKIRTPTGIHGVDQLERAIKTASRCRSLPVPIGVAAALAPAAYGFIEISPRAVAFRKSLE